jgi:hypothetical protein
MTDRHEELDAMLRYRRLEAARPKLAQRIALKAQSILRPQPMVRSGRESSNSWQTKTKSQEEKSMKKILIGTMGLCLFASGVAFAGPSTVDSQLQVKTANGISHASGGFGLDERDNLRSMRKDDNLELSFALQNKDYLGGAKVLVKDTNGKEIIETVSDGPLFFAKLPAGTYTVEATTMGQTLKQMAHVPSKGQTQLYFAWKEKESNPTRG